MIGKEQPLSEMTNNDYFAYFSDWRGLDVWMVQLNFSAGGPYEVTASSTVIDKIVTKSLLDIYFGDVWLCSGQSNMVFTTNMVWTF